MKPFAISTSLWLGFAVCAAAEEAATRGIVRYPGVATRAAMARKTYGTSQDSVHRLTAQDFEPASSATQYAFTDGISTIRRYASSPGSHVFLASPHLPSGARITGVSFDVCDDDPLHDVAAQVVTADSLGGNLEILGDLVFTTGMGPCQSLFEDLSTEGYVVDNAANELYLDIILQSGTASHSLAGASVFYRLRVSPAPDAASFSDVPTSHPFFRYIEALKASGITAGCQAAPPLYCPNNPVTRGQMAVFLAKALGLHFP